MESNNAQLGFQWEAGRLHLHLKYLSKRGLVVVNLEDPTNSHPHFWIVPMELCCRVGEQQGTWPSQEDQELLQASQGSLYAQQVQISRLSHSRQFPN